MTEKPNIILIMTDQQRYDTIGALGFDYMETPNLDRLVREGVSFDNCFVTGPTCVPSRASFFHGLYPHTTGIYKNQDLWQHSWVENLSEEGYHCVNIGKMHTTPFETPLGFDERFVVENKDRYLEGRYYLDRWDMALQSRGVTKPQRELYRERDDYDKALGAFDWSIEKEMHPDIFVGNTASWWINHKPKLNRPLFLQIGFPGPHPPYDAVSEYASVYEKKDLPRVELSPEEVEKQTNTLKAINRENCQVDHDSVLWSENPSTAQIHNMRSHYYGNVTMIDEKVGEIIEALEKKGYLENSIIIFTSDHGDCMGDHGHSQKWSMFEQIVRVPMIIWSPERFRQNIRIKELCQHFDLAPTILELAGAEIPDYFEAESVTKALSGEGYEGRDYVFCEQGEDGRLKLGHCRQMTMIRDKTWKLVHYLGLDEGELYCLKNDPGEHINLWDNPDYAEKKGQLLSRMLEWSLESSLKTESWNHSIR